MDADIDARFFGDGGDLVNHVGVVVPQFVFGIDAAMGEITFVDGAGPVALGVFDVEHAGTHATAAWHMAGAPDAVTHVGVGIVFDASGAEIANESFEFFDFGVTTRQIEGHLGGIVHAEVGNTVDFEPVVPKAFDQPFVKIKGVQFGVVDAHHGPFNAELLVILQIFVAGVGMGLDGELNPCGTGKIARHCPHWNLGATTHRH